LYIQSAKQPGSPAILSSMPCQAPFDLPKLPEPLSFVVPAQIVCTTLHSKKYFLRLSFADEGEDLATEIREYYIPEFSNWKNHDPYQTEFEKLLRALRSDESKTT